MGALTTDAAAGQREAGRPSAAEVDLLAVIRALRQHALLHGMNVPYGLVREMVARSAGFTGVSQMEKARGRGPVVVRLDPEVLVVSMRSWSVPITLAEAEECAAAGTTTAFNVP